MKISVLMNVYNAEQFLDEAITSVLAQTFKDFELIIINDGSTDNSQAIIANYQAKDNRIRAYEQKNKGIPATLNKGLELAQADYIARIDADDVCYPQRLQVQYDYMLDNNLILCGSFIEFIDSNSVFIRKMTFPISDKACRQFLSQKNIFLHSSVMYKKESVLQVGAYRSAFRVTQDYDLWLRLIETDGLVGNINQFLVQYRAYSSNVSNAHRKEQAINAVVARYAYHLRQLSIPDGQDKSIDSDYLQAKLPAQLKSNFKVDYFEASNIDIFEISNLKIKSIADIEQSLQAFAKIEHLTDKRIKVSYYLKIAKKYLNNRAYGQCIIYLLRSYASDIKESLALTKYYLQRKFEK